MFASQAAIAIRNEELLSEATTQRNAQESLVLASQFVASSNNLQQTFQAITKQASELVKAQYSHLALVKTINGKKIIEFVAAYPPYHLEGLEKNVGTIDLDHGALHYPTCIGITGLAVKEETFILLPDVKLAREKDPKIANAYIAYVNDTASELAMPIFGETGEVIGVINLEHRTTHALTEAHVEIIRLFAVQAAIAIQKNRLIQREQNRAEQLQNLYAASNVIMSSQPDKIEQILIEVIKITCQTFGASAGVIIPFENEDPVTAKIVTNEYKFKDPLFIREDGISKAVYSGKKPYFMSVNTKHDNEINPKITAAGIGSAMCLPLSSNTGNIGVVWLHFPTERTQIFEDHEIKTFLLFANQIAIAYENALQIKKTRNRLEKLQQQLKEESRAMTEGIEGDYQTSRRQSWLYFGASFTVGLLGILIVFLSIIYSSNKEPVVAAIGSVAGIIMQAASALVFTRATAANERMDKYHNELLQIRLLNILLTSSEKLEDETSERDSKRQILSAVTSTWFKSPNANNMP